MGKSYESFRDVILAFSSGPLPPNYVPGKLFFFILKFLIWEANLIVNLQILSYAPASQ